MRVNLIDLNNCIRLTSSDEESSDDVSSLDVSPDDELFEENFGFETSADSGIGFVGGVGIGIVLFEEDFSDD